MRQVERGVTIPELLVAISVTVMMLMITASVFKAATDAAGQAKQYTATLKNMQLLTLSLDEDLKGFRPDMPFAIIFEAHRNDNLDPTWVQNDYELGDPDEDTRWVRYDRLVFFANGNFKSNYSGTFTSANLARIFYGQSADWPPLVEETVAPPRKIFTRRMKMQTVYDGNTPIPFLPNPPDPRSPGNWHDVYGGDKTTYDTNKTEYGTMAFWQQQPASDFMVYYFNDRLDTVVSFVRRPMLADHNGENLQSMYFLPDVTDFTVQVWFDQLGRWFPDNRDYEEFASGVGAKAFALYWNVDDMTGTPTPIQSDKTAGGAATYIDWWSESELISELPGLTSDAWPSAVRFRFTLYDEGRRHFPEGRQFEYIVKLPERAN